VGKVTTTHKRWLLFRCLRCNHININLLETKKGVDEANCKLDQMMDMLTNQNQSGVENNYFREPPAEDADDDRSVEEGGSILGKGVFGTTFRMRNVLDDGIYAVKRVNQVEVKLFVK
jgi:transcription elongation factor Elf1